MTLTAALTLIACASVPGASPRQARLDLQAALRCAPAQVQLPDQGPVLFQRCGEAGHPLEPVENLFREIEVLELARRDGRWVAHVRRSSASGQVVFRYVLDDAGEITERTCLPGVPEVGTPVAMTEGRTVFVDWCASVAPPCRPPSTGAFGTHVRFELEDGRLVRPKRNRVAIDDLGEAPADTCVYELQALPVSLDATIERIPDSEVVLWRPEKARVEHGELSKGDLLLVPRGPARIRVQGGALAVGGERPTALRPVRSEGAGRAWKTLITKAEVHPKGRLKWDGQRFVLGLGATREIWRPLDDGTLQATCRFVESHALDAPESTDLPTGSDCRGW